MKRKYKKIIIFSAILVSIFIISILAINFDNKKTTIQTNNTIISNKTIEWGIKRGKDHSQPDVGTINKNILETYQGIYMGNKNSKYIYLTFDEGYEAGYTPKILEILKENSVPATFFITAHYLNTQPELVKQMIDDGHIVGNHTPKFLMSGSNINVKC